MMQQTEIVESVERICNSMIVIVEDIRETRINTEIDYDTDSVTDFLTPFDGLKLTDLIADRFKIDKETFMNLQIIHLPVRFMACFILLNAKITV